jgi:hypothetical protein
MSLTRVSREGKTVTEQAIGGQLALSIPFDYIKYRGLKKGQRLYAHIKKIGDKIVFCYSEFNPEGSTGAAPELRSIVAHSINQFRINMPTFFYTAMNHQPGDRYEVFHDSEGTLIYEKLDQ